MKRTDIYERGLDSTAIWTNNAATFLVGELTLTQHAADVDLLSTRLYQLAQAADALDTARAARNGAADLLRPLYTRACQLISGTAAIGDSISQKVLAVQRESGQSFVGVKQKGEKLVIAWQAVNAHRAALAPAQPPLLVGVKAVSALQSDLGNYAQFLKNVSAKEDPLACQRELARAIAARVDQNNKRWYKAWLGQFPAGSPQRAALSIIDTGSSLTEPGPATFLTVQTLPNQVVKLAYGASRATSFTLFHKGPNQPAFVVLANGLTAKTFAHTATDAGEHAYKVKGHNSVGAGAESSELKVNVAQQAVA